MTAGEQEIAGWLAPWENERRKTKPLSPLEEVALLELKSILGSIRDLVNERPGFQEFLVEWCNRKFAALRLDIAAGDEAGL